MIRQHIGIGLHSSLRRRTRPANLRSAYQILNMQYTPSCSRQLPDLMRLADGASSETSLECSELKRSDFSQLLNVRRSTSAAVNLVQPVESCQINVEPPSLQEVSDAINLLKNNQAAGVCEISAEMIKYGGDVVVEAVFQLISQIWEQEKLLTQWTRSLLVPVFKSGDKAVLDNYRSISLISIPCKIFSLLIQKRLSAWVDAQLLEQQCGFRSGRSCNDAIFSMRLLHEHAVRKKAPIFTAFTDWFEVGTGFKQGDVNAPMLFNLFLDTVLRDMQAELEPLGMSFLYRVDGTLREMPSRNLPDSFWSVLVADDMGLVAASEGDMQKALKTADQTFNRWGLELSLKKTKVMVLGVDVRPTCFAIARGQIEVVSDFKYLGQLLGSRWGHRCGNITASEGGCFRFSQAEGLLEGQACEGACEAQGLQSCSAGHLVVCLRDSHL